MGLILDTSAIISLERNPHLWSAGGIPPDEEIIMPAIVWAEALIGVRLADTAQRAAQRLSRLEKIHRITGVHAFTDVIAEHCADIFAELQQKGSLIPQNDMQVAATARSLGFAVLVGRKDEAHFRRVDGLKVRIL